MLFRSLLINLADPKLLNHSVFTTYEDWEDDVPVSVLSVHLQQMPSSAGCPSHAVSVTKSHICDYCHTENVLKVSECAVKHAICSKHLHHMLFEDFWPSDLKSQTHWRNVRSLFHWTPDELTSSRVIFKIVVTIHCRSNTVYVTFTLSWELSITLMLLSEEVTSGPNSTLPRSNNKMT